MPHIIMSRFNKYFPSCWLFFIPVEAVIGKCRWELLFWSPHTWSSYEKRSAFVLHTIESLWLYQAGSLLFFRIYYKFFRAICLFYYPSVFPIYMFCIEPARRRVLTVGVQAGFTRMVNLFQMSVRNASLSLLTKHHLVRPYMPVRSSSLCHT